MESLYDIVSGLRCVCFYCCRHRCCHRSLMPLSSSLLLWQLSLLVSLRVRIRTYQWVFAVAAFDSCLNWSETWISKPGFIGIGQCVSELWWIELTDDDQIQSNFSTNSEQIINNCTFNRSALSVHANDPARMLQHILTNTTLPLTKFYDGIKCKDRDIRKKCDLLLALPSIYLQMRLINHGRAQIITPIVHCTVNALDINLHERDPSPCQWHS